MDETPLGSEMHHHPLAVATAVLVMCVLMFLSYLLTASASHDIRDKKKHSKAFMEIAANVLILVLILALFAFVAPHVKHMFLSMQT